MITETELALGMLILMFMGAVALVYGFTVAFHRSHDHDES